MFSLENVEKPLVLLCVRSKILKNQWFYYVFAQKCWKTNGFIMFSLKNIEKSLVLWCFRSKMMTIGFMEKTQTKWKNHYALYEKVLTIV